MLNLDTHILLEMIGGGLTPRERAALKAQSLGISAIVLWEMTKLYQLGRISLSLHDPALSEIISALHVWPITPEICAATLALDFRSDPADELIAATSIAHRVPLATRDEKIRKSKLIRFAPE